MISIKVLFPVGEIDAPQTVRKIPHAIELWLNDSISIGVANHLSLASQIGLVGQSCDRRDDHATAADSLGLQPARTGAFAVAGDTKRGSELRPT